MTETGVSEKVMEKQIADDFVEFWESFHEHNQPYDDEMDADIHERYAKVLRKQSKWGYFDFKKNPKGVNRPHFSPSSANYTPMELYMKARKAKRDPAVFTQNQRDWVGLGSVIGDYVQREILLAERHYKKLVGESPRFTMARNRDGDPAYEHFVKKMQEIEHKGQSFAYFGLPDGILKYVTEDGETINVGLEVKSEQANWSKFKAMDEPKPQHIPQGVAYSEMYKLDYILYVYMLSYGRAWKEDFTRIKAYGVHVSDTDREDLKDRCSQAVMQSKGEVEAPEFTDLDDWIFNDYKTQIATEMTDDRFDKLKAFARRSQDSSLPAYVRRNHQEAIDEITEIRERR